jgi:dTDP-4-dehydrorhamnose 3,5-epimerase
VIFGVSIRPLKQIHDERGKVMHMLRADDENFLEFGEIYFSNVYPGVVKAWHLHRQMTLNYAVIAGAIKLVLFDPRQDSPTYGNVQEIFLSPENYLLVTVPPMVWNGFKGIGMDSAIVANCATHPHDPLELERLPPDTNEIPYRWDLVNR